VELEKCVYTMTGLSMGKSWEQRAAFGEEVWFGVIRESPAMIKSGGGFLKFKYWLGRRYPRPERVFNPRPTRGGAFLEK